MTQPDPSDEITRLLTEIRDLHRDQLASYKDAVERSLAMQEEAMRVQSASFAKQKLGLLIALGMMFFLCLFLYVVYWL